MKVLVCGGRGFSNRRYLFDSLDAINEREAAITHVIHGGASGADSMAGQWASTHCVQEVRCPANWMVQGKSAGPIRNRAMLGLLPDIVVAFDGGAGTANMVAEARKAGVPVRDLRLSVTENVSDT